jgi:hypothetical protein
VIKGRNGMILSGLKAWKRSFGTRERRKQKWRET